MTAGALPPAERRVPGWWLMAAAAVSGPAAAALNIQAGYALVKWACAEDGKSVLYAIAATALIVALAGAWLSWQLLVSSRRPDGPPTMTSRESATFLSATLLGLNLLLALQIAWSGIAVYVLSPCD